MPSQKYPFVRFQYSDGSIDKKGQTFLPVRVSNPSTGVSRIYWGLIDTGASSCLFPSKLAFELGHDLKAKGVKANITSGIEQTPVTTYKHTFKLELLSADRRKVVWRSRKLRIACADSNPPVLLGVADMLASFKLTIDYPQEIVRLQW